MLITIPRSSRDTQKPTTSFQGVYSLNYSAQLKDGRTLSCNTRPGSTTWLNFCILNYTSGPYYNHRYLQRIGVNYPVSLHTSCMTAATRKAPFWRRSGSSSNKRAVRQPHPFGAFGKRVPLCLKLPKTMTSLFDGQIS